MNYIYKGIICGLTSISTFLFLIFNKNNIILTFFAYQFMYYYSYVEINLKKNINIMYNLPIVKNSIYNFKIYMYNEVELIKNNFVIETCNIKEVVKYNPHYFDLFIYTDYYTLNKIVSKNLNFSIDVEKCNYKFYLFNLKISNVELIDDNKSFIIDMNNYFMVNNIINKFLICFLLNRQYNVFLLAETVNYTLEILDNNMDFKSITEKQEIILNKDTYILSESVENNKIKSDEKFFNSDEKISNNIKFINEEDFDLLNY